MNPRPESELLHPETEPELLPPSGHGKMPLVLLLLWIGNISFFFFYFVKYGWADLIQWLER
jgi:hypothetical protein